MGTTDVVEGNEIVVIEISFDSIAGAHAAQAKLLSDRPKGLITVATQLNIEHGTSVLIVNVKNRRLESMLTHLVRDRMYYQTADGRLVISAVMELLPSPQH